MARIKIKYELADIKTDLYTFGKEWVTDDGQEYIGLYHRYISTGEIYTGAKWDKNISKPLTAFEIPSSVTTYKKINPISLKFNTPYPERPVITEQDQKQGFFTRYFLKKFNELNVIEISKKQYESYQNNKIDNNAYVATKLQWYISGQAAMKNTKNIELASQQIPEIRSVLTNAMQFYTDTDFNVPADINGLK